METILQESSTTVGGAMGRRGGLTLTESLVVRRTLLAGLALGILGDVLLRDGASGIGFTLFVVATLVALGGLMRVRRAPWTLGACLLLVPTLFFTATFVWRDSASLAFYNVLALLAALAALATALLRGEEWEPMASLGAYLRGGRRVATSTLGGTAWLLSGGGGVRDLTAGGRFRHAPAVARGAAITVPLLVIFGSLFISADSVFARLVHGLIDVDLGVLASHLVVASCVGWVAAGYLRSALLLPVAKATRTGSSRQLSLGIVEVAVAIGSLDALFLGFVLVQLRYLFGGAAHVAATTGGSYADYARSGFFELVWVAVLVLPLLLAADALLRRAGRRDQLLFRTLAGVLLVLLGVVMLSAMERMWLYQQAYGLTETRLYASAAMGWLALVFIWFAATVLRGRRAPFAFGGLVSAWIVMALVDVANPDALIARTNLARIGRPGRFDASYLTTLGADATPRLLDAVSGLPEPEGCTITRALLARRHATHDWRGWNIARARADGALAERAPELEARRCPDPRRASGT